RNRGQRRQGAGRRVGAVELTVVPAQHDGRIRRGTNLRVDADTRRAHDEAGRIAVVPQRTDALASRCVVVPYVVLDHVLVAERDGVVAATHLRTVGARHVADDDAAVFADRRDTGNAEVVGRPRSGTASDHLDLHVEDAGGVRVFAGVRGVFPRGGHDRVGEHDGVIAGPWNLPKRRRQAGVFGGAGEAHANWLFAGGPGDRNLKARHSVHAGVVRALDGRALGFAGIVQAETDAGAPGGVGLVHECLAADAHAATGPIWGDAVHAVRGCDGIGVAVPGPLNA